MFRRIEITSAKNLAGIHVRMAWSHNKTYELWNAFMKRRSELINAIGAELYSVEVYPPDYSFQKFDPHTVFEKWAAVQVNNSGQIPAGMETLKIEGSYAVFVHKGLQSEGARTYNYIYSEWLPSSGFTLDQRPHFAVMGALYNPGSADSEEEIFIPVQVA